ncbi:23S rRNA pseudouridine(1911/1915/1917) synthase RluD [Zooshikella ganghwensis]|uniref:Pseudouridine synthase n=1 Tax=Zooshikella ganghwensis TaxID=202772 RepID=A0A4P9VR06_9GAMM|nr:23S rRNA pseudouridine(1911/1915/1917) synthase RluD [Zooshikella ganghwensis]RDH45466.1 23S rRNA pseudouridine(1911/1915/1917) synthase RluD [Zooshikella ganghwensis]
MTEYTQHETQIELEAVVPMTMSGQRLDQIAAHCFSEYSRSRLQAWIKSGQLKVDQHQAKPKDKLLGGETLTVQAALEAEERWVAEDIPLDIVFEDDDLIVLNKPAGLVVHPAAGHAQGTLLNALLHHCPALATVPRAGIVHRLDKDTTGLMVVAKNLTAHCDLVEQLQARTVSREYEALVYGAMTAGGTVEQPIGRHPHDRKKMAVVETGKPAVSHYRVLQRFDSATLVKVKLETGRTHQIRVHMSYLHYPLVGDTLYGGRLRLPKGASPQLQSVLHGFSRQALHARRLGLIHPSQEEYCEWQVDRPADFQQLISAFEQG